MNNQSIAEMTAAYIATHGEIETIPAQGPALNYGFNNRPVNGPTVNLRKTTRAQKVLAYIDRHGPADAAVVSVATGVPYDGVLYVAQSHGIELPKAEEITGV